MTMLSIVLGLLPYCLAAVCLILALAVSLVKATMLSHITFFVALSYLALRVDLASDTVCEGAVLDATFVIWFTLCITAAVAIVAEWRLHFYGPQRTEQKRERKAW